MPPVGGGEGRLAKPREGRQEAGCARSGMRQEAVPKVPERATPGTEADRRWWWAEASIWTERMVSALVDGVKGGKGCGWSEASAPGALTYRLWARARR